MYTEGMNQRIWLFGPVLAQMDLGNSYIGHLGIGRNLDFQAMLQIRVS